MTKVTSNNYVNHNTFGGEIDLDDFNTSSPNKRRISNQLDAMNLEYQIKNKESEKRYKNMTLEELKEMKIISSTNGRPSNTLTNEKWQKEFNVRKLFITPYSKKILKLGGAQSKESGNWNEEIRGKYQGCTNWQQYCSYINNVLINIRAGQVDYCYFLYQIMDLAKFHLNDLRTKYCDGYWEVWLEMR